MSKAKPFIIMAVVAIIAVAVYNRVIRPRVAVAPAIS